MLVGGGGGGGGRGEGRGEEVGLGAVDYCCPFLLCDRRHYCGAVYLRLVISMERSELITRLGIVHDEQTQNQQT